MCSGILLDRNRQQDAVCYDTNKLKLHGIQDFEKNVSF